MNLKNKFCWRPFGWFEISPNGNASCCCPSWVKFPIGNFNDKPMEELWNGELIQKIRRSILDGTFEYCNKDICADIQVGLPDKTDFDINHYKVIMPELPIYFSFSFDSSCTLTCPSCRQHVQFHKRGSAEFEVVSRLKEKIQKELLTVPSDRQFSLNMLGSGDVFSSISGKEMIDFLDASVFPNMKVNFQTNGRFLDKSMWDRMHKIHGNIESIKISLDASCEKTYNITRRGSNWDKVLDNIHMLSDLRKENKFNTFFLEFVVQKANYKEMLDFVRLAKKYYVDNVLFSLILDWNVQPKEVYKDMCVWDESHPEYNEFVEILKDPILDDDIVFLGNVSRIRNKILLDKNVKSTKLGRRNINE
jgi:sulfatase maturation enzyme AslB (radical SAM superfamily)